MLLAFQGSNPCPSGSLANLGPRGPVGLKAGGADRCPAIGQPGPEAQPLRNKVEAKSYPLKVEAVWILPKAGVVHSTLIRIHYG